MQLENVEDVYPLSPAQQGMLFHDLLEPGAGVYSVQLSFAINGTLDVDAFRRSWEMVLQRHPALRTAFAWEGLDQPLQIVRKQVQLPWTGEDWSHDGSREAKLISWLQSDRLSGFGLAQAPLMRVALIRMAPDEWRCVWSHHHLILDGWSVGLVLRDVLACYVALIGRREPMWQSCRPYREYIAWLQRQDLARADAFWRETLGGIESATPLGIEAPTSAAGEEKTHFHGEQQCKLDPQTTAGLQAFARQHQLTLNTLVSGALGLCLSRYTGSSEVVLGTTVSGRPTDLPGADSIVGMFINTLPLRVAVPDEQRTIEWLRDLQAQQADMTPFAATPLVRIQAQTSVPAGQPLFQSILVFENYPVDESLAQAPTGLRIGASRGMEQTNYPLAVYAVPGQQLTLRVGHDRRRVDDAAAARMLGHLRALLESIIAKPDALLWQHDLMTAAERYEIVEQFNETAVEVPHNLLVHELVENQVHATPKATAAICGQDKCTYEELNRRADEIAARLSSLGVYREHLVGICLHRSVDMLAAVLGVLKSGAAYVPLDPAFPRQRLEMMIEDAEPRVIITQSELADTLPPSSAKLMKVRDTVASVAARPPASNSVAPNAKRAAYVIFTSGSTGAPKGVVVEHGAVVNFLSSMARRPGLSRSDTLVAVTTLSFDIAGLELLLPLTVGARVVIATAEQAADPYALSALIDQHAATVLQATPATWRMLLESGWQGRTDLRMLCGGEALSRELSAELLHRGKELWNLYGPTETTIWSSVQQIKRDDPTISIGRPIANTRMYILDRRLQPVPIGATGELYIAGYGVARGYLNRPELTAERFIADPLSTDGNGRMYRTGDLARYRFDGTIECLGRVDHQVKIRGFRIELGEIESAMAQHADVRQTVVIDREDTPGDKRLVAYWIATGTAAPGVEDLRRHLRERLPEYMVPSAFVKLDAFPLTPNGKIDRRALPAPSADRQETGESFIAPRDAQEQMLAEIWSQLLGRSPIGANDNFFALGGHSLLATRLVSKIREKTGMSLPLRSVFDAPTVEGLAQQIRNLTPTEAGADAIGTDLEEGSI